MSAAPVPLRAEGQACTVVAFAPPSPPSTANPPRENRLWVIRGALTRAVLVLAALGLAVPLRRGLRARPPESSTRSFCPGHRAC